MKGGDLDYFLNQVYDGEEVFFKVYGKHYLYQGYVENSKYVRILECCNEDDPDYGTVWKYACTTGFDELYEAFLKAPVFKGKTLMEAEPDIEWTDSNFETYEDYVPPKED